MNNPAQNQLLSWAVVVMAPFCWSCATGGDSDMSKDASARRVEAVVWGIIAADNAGDLDRAVSFYADDAVLISPSGPDIAGREDIRAHYAALFDANSLSIETEIFETVISGGWAINRGVNHVIATARDDGTKAAVTSKYLMTLRKDASGEWRIAHLSWSNQPANPEQASD